jgi:hypothetical protein
MSCSGQCNEHCKKNEYLGPGTFRLVAFSCTGGATIHGPPFQLAAEPADRG